MKAPTVAHVAETLRLAGLAPIIDTAMASVRAECPACRAGSRDPVGLHRPLLVACAGGPPVRTVCTAGCPDVAVWDALNAPPVDWEAIAHKAITLAHDQQRLIGELAA